MIMDRFTRLINHDPKARMIDKVKYQECFQYFDEEIIVQVIDIFLMDTPGLLTAIRQNLFDRNYQALLVNVIKVKGSVVNFCDTTAIDLARRLEYSVCNKIWGDVDALLLKLEDAIADLEQEFKEIKNRMTAA